MKQKKLKPSTEVRIVGDYVDEIVSDEVEFFHLEYMSKDHVWIGLNLKDGRNLLIDLTSKKRITTTTCMEAVPFTLANFGSGWGGGGLL